MQEIIDTEFKGCTVLAVMHRLKHITQYHKVALLDNGLLLEFDTPAALLARESKFAGLYRSM
jgi:ATP-binding cassette subfamily C (CFTR/MRP) protein 1